MRDRDLDFTIARLGEGRVRSPMSNARFTRDDERVLYHTGLEEMKAWLDRGKILPRWSRRARGSRCSSTRRGWPAGS